LEKGKNRGMPDFYFYFSLENRLSNNTTNLFSGWWVTGQRWEMGDGRLESMKNQREKRETFLCTEHRE
jgi:hypothetical protein